MDALVLKTLRKVYKNGVEALKGIDLVVREGDFFALLGPNGAGKTTAIGIITSLIRKSSGFVSVFGYDIERDRDAAKACIGVVPQEINLNMFERNDLTLINQAGYYGVPFGVARERAEKYLKALHLWDRRLDVARTLSGCMKRRLMIARAPALDGYAARLRNEHEIEVDVTKGQGLNRLFETLSAQSLHVSSMRTKTNRLEELFMRLVEDKPTGNDR